MKIGQFYTWKNIDEKMNIVVKLIETSNVNLSNRIIETTNSQSQVMKEALVSMRPFHRKIEDFFTVMREKGYEYYYERRSHQYDDYTIKKNHIISIPSLIKAFVSVVLSEPHKVHYYYGSLIKDYIENDGKEKDYLFNDAQHPEMYFIAHYIVNLCGKRIKNNKKLRPWLYHMAFLIKEDLLPQLRYSNDYTDKNIQDFIEKLDGEFVASFEKNKNLITKMQFKENENRLDVNTKKLKNELYKTNNN